MLVYSEKASCFIPPVCICIRIFLKPHVLYSLIHTVEVIYYFYVTKISEIIISETSQSLMMLSKCVITSISKTGSPDNGAVVSFIQDSTCWASIQCIHTFYSGTFGALSVGWWSSSCLCNIKTTYNLSELSLVFEGADTLLNRKVQYLIQVNEFPEVATDMRASAGRWFYRIKEYVRYSTHVLWECLAQNKTLILKA